MGSKNSVIRGIRSENSLFGLLPRNLPVEGHHVFGSKLTKLVDSESNAVFVVSQLSKMECLVLPYRQSDDQLIRLYREWFDATEIASTNSAVFETATVLRADHPRLKTPDALHIATAVNFGCDEFWTNDNRLSSLTQLTILNLMDDISHA